METKKARVTKITKMEQKDQYGNTSFIIEFENGDKGYYRSKDELQTKFIANNVADYVIEEKTGTKGKYYTVKPPQAERPAFGGGGRVQQDPRIQMISFAAAYAKDIICAGKATPESFEFQFDKIYNKMISKL